MVTVDETMVDSERDAQRVSAVTIDIFPPVDARDGIAGILHSRIVGTQEK